MDMPTEDKTLTLINGMKPTFDFSELSWGDSFDLLAAQTRIMELSALDKITVDDLRDMASAFQSVSRHLSIVTTCVPRTWLTKTAPEQLDWSDPNSYRWVLQAKIPALMQALGQAQTETKNE